MADRKLHIDQLIINSPYDEPAEHWSYDAKSRLFTRTAGRRPAGYVKATEGSRSFDDPGVFVELPLVNRIRPRVTAWREAGYPGVTGITKRLLEHWRDPEERENRRFFFCQLEAIETQIWLSEASPAERQGLEIPGDGGPFARRCAKMATGSGKTIVMAMLVAWHIANKAANPQDKRFSKNVFIVAPGLTVRNRLAVLAPDGEGNYYDEFNIVPLGMRELLRQGRVLIRNWHALNWESEEQLAKRKGVDKRGAKSDEAYVRDVLGEMAAARNIVVLNDEAHHAWRVSGLAAKGISREEVDEATKWIGGLDRINRARGIMQCFDLSATPFAPSGKKAGDEALFGWVVSDFGLTDSIESGLVKTPRVVVRDDSWRAEDYKSRLYHIYIDPTVKDDLNRKAEEHEPLPDLVNTGFHLLGKDWLETARRWQENGSPTPPVMISVANRTETAARVKYAFDHGKIRIPELSDPARTLHIDSRVLGKAESLEEPPELNGAAEPEETSERDEPEERLTKKQFAERLRQQVDTIGRPGKPGEQIQNVISVGMLSEGWDAKTVTHIMGLRAFTSQLLCEQVVGRGLRRTTYETYKTADGKEMFSPEYVNVFGVPFTFMPHEGDDETEPPPPEPAVLVEPLAERRKFQIDWPNVIRVDHVYRPQLVIDLDKVPVLPLNAMDIATIAEMAPVIEGKPDLTRLTEINFQDLAREYRLQKIVFEVARDQFDLIKPNWPASRESLLAQLIRLVENVLQSDRIAIQPEVFGRDPLRRRVILTFSMTRVVQHIWEAIRFQNTEALEAVFDREHPIRSTADMPTWYTRRPNEPTRRSHINRCVYDSTWEASEAFELDRNENVAAWAKNDHLGFEVLYVYDGVVRKFRPDFLIRLTNGTLLVLEIKGEDSQQSRTKRRFLDEWVQAVNQQGGFGRWAWDVSFNPADLPDILARHNRDWPAVTGRVESNPLHPHGVRSTLHGA